VASAALIVAGKRIDDPMPTSLRACYQVGTEEQGLCGFPNHFHHLQQCCEYIGGSVQVQHLTSAHWTADSSPLVCTIVALVQALPAHPTSIDH